MNAQELIKTARTLLTGLKGQLLLDAAACAGSAKQEAI